MKARANLRLAKLTLPQKIEKARQWVIKIGANAIFVNPFPTLAEVTAAADDAEVAFNNAQGAGPALTAVMYAKAVALDNVLARVGNYVEIIANGEDAIILAAGMDVRGKGGRGSSVFEVADGDLPGEAVLQSPVTLRGAYVWERSTDPLPTEPPAAANGSKWEHIAFTTIATVTVTNLVAGTKYWFRVATVTSAGQQPWSGPISYIGQ